MAGDQSAAGVGMTTGTAGSALVAPQSTYETISIGGAVHEVMSRSIKCDVGMIDGVSTMRLADCDSARLISLAGDPDKTLIRFAIKPEDVQISEGTRAELGDTHLVKNGEESWYRLAVALPKDFPLGHPKSLVLAQWHEAAPPGSHSFRPPLAHRLVNGEFIVSLWNSAIYDKSTEAGDGEPIYRDAQFKLDVFHEFIYRIAWFPDARGHVTGWRRVACLTIDASCTEGPWQRFVDYRGAIGYPDMLGYYFKYGLYTTHPLSKPLTAYNFGYRRGPTAASVGASEAIFAE